MNKLINIFKKKEFTDDEELKSFCDFLWGSYIRNIDKVVIVKLISVQSHGLIRGEDDEIIMTYQREMDNFPPIPFDIVVYRGGKMHIKGRPFLSASFYKNVALDDFAAHKKRRCHMIILKKGAKVVPSLYLSIDNGSFSEQEVILNVSRLHKRIGYYIYK